MINLKINGKLADQHFIDVKDSIQNRIREIIRRNYILVDRVRINLLPININSINIYLDDNILKELITLDPLSLKNRVADIHNNHNQFIDENSVDYKLHYRVFVDWGYDKIDNLKLINSIGIDTCPYCNRNYIYALDKAGKIKPELDHFYPKGIYPLLAASYYNLIPSCQTCNGIGGKYKSDPFVCQLKNPYLIESTDFEFSYKLVSLAKVHPISGKSSIEIKFSKCINSHCDIFKLDKLYEKHTDHVLELIVKSRLKYTSKYRSYLRSYSGLKFSETEIDRLILGNYSKVNDLHKRPLSKLYSDIGRKLGLI